MERNLIATTGIIAGLGSCVGFATLDAIKIKELYDKCKQLEVMEPQKLDISHQNFNYSFEEGVYSIK